MDASSLLVHCQLSSHNCRSFLVHYHLFVYFFKFYRHEGQLQRTKCMNEAAASIGAPTQDAIWSNVWLFIIFKDICQIQKCYKYSWEREVRYSLVFQIETRGLPFKLYIRTRHVEIFPKFWDIFSAGKWKKSRVVYVSLKREETRELFSYRVAPKFPTSPPILKCFALEKPACKI